MQTAMETTSNKTVLNVINMLDKESTHEYKLYLHFADFQNSQLRQFNVCINDQPPFQFSPSYLAADAVSNVHGWYNAKDGVYTVDLVPTAASNLPPMLNAYELYIRIHHVNPKTFPSDCKDSLPIYQILLCFLWFMFGCILDISMSHKIQIYIVNLQTH